MTITFTGNEIPETEREITGYYSLDKALMNPVTGARGFPLRTMVEICGPSGIGKTTFMMTIGGLLASRLGGKIALADFEGQSRETVEHSLMMGGFLGELDLCKTPKTVTHSNMLDQMIEIFYEQNCNVAMLDSMGAFMPPAELEGSVDDANMGKRPFILGNWTRKIVHILGLDGNRKVCFYVTHQHSNIGFLGKHTSGGETKNYLRALQIELKKKDDYDTGWVLEGKTLKNRYGAADQFFRVFCVGGQGIHRGLSAVFDCVAAGIAEIDRNVVKLDGESYGKVARMIETWQEENQFVPFINALIARDVRNSVENDEEIRKENLGEMIIDAPLTTKKKGRPKKND